MVEDATPDGAFVASSVSVHFGELVALDDIDFVLRPGEIVGLIGPNGAGKTTLTNVLSGFQRPTRGSVTLDGTDVTRWQPDRLARGGVCRTFQSVRAFGAISVWQNVEAAASAIGLRRRERTELVGRLLSTMGLYERREVPARDLPHGDERRMSVARALAVRPRYLLLDEPAAGLNEHESDDLVGALSLIRRDFGCGLMVIEHDMRVIMSLCERIHVLDHGRSIASGTPSQIQADPAVLTAYLGSTGRAA